MHLNFSENERNWIDKTTPFEWGIKRDCPPSIKKMIERKLKMLNNMEKSTSKMQKRKEDVR